MLRSGDQASIRHTLGNGAIVRISPMPFARSVAVQVVSRIGSGYETAPEQGLSHFVEHMVFKGASSRPTYAEIAAAIEGLGGSINAATEPEMTAVWTKVASGHLDIAVDVIADMLGASRFDRDEVEKERRVIQDELGMIADVPEEAVRRSIRTRLWPHHGIGREIAGPPENIRTFSVDQLRAHASRMFSGANLVISVAGNVDPQKALDAVTAGFARLPAGRTAAWPAFSANGSMAPRVDIDDREGEQVYLCVAGRTLAREDPDRYAMDLCCAALGEGMGSRLFAELREQRGLVYEVFSQLVVYRDSGAMVIESSTGPDGVDDALQAILHELARIRRSGVSAPEFERAREYVKGEILLSMEDTQAVAAWYAREELLESEQLAPDDVVAKLDAVRRGDIRRIAARVLGSEWAIVAASGPIDADAPLPANLDGTPVRAE